MPAAGHITDGMPIAVQQQIDEAADLIFMKKCHIPLGITALFHIAGEIDTVLVKTRKEIIPDVQGVDLLRVGKYPLLPPPSV